MIYLVLGLMEIIYDGEISTKRYIEKYQPNNISEKIAKYRRYFPIYRRYFSLLKAQFGWSTWALVRSTRGCYNQS